MLNIQQATKYLGVARSTLETMVRLGFLCKATKKKGRNYWSKEDLDGCRPELERRKKAMLSNIIGTKTKDSIAAVEYMKPPGYDVAFKALNGASDHLTQQKELQ